MSTGQIARLCYYKGMTSSQALGEMKRLLDGGRVILGGGDLVYSNVTVFEAEQSIAAATKCAAQTDGWVIEGIEGGLLVIAFRDGYAVIVGHQR